MKRLFPYVLGAGLLGGLAAACFFYSSQGREEPSLEDLGIVPPPLSERLYPGLTDGKGGLPLEESSVRVGNMVYVKNRDHSTVDIELKPGSGDVPGGDQILSSRSYFPVQKGERGRRPHVNQVYGAGAGLSLDKQVWRLNGSLAEHTQVMEDKSKHVVDFGPDGKTYVGEQWFDRPPLYTTEPVLREEQRWRLDKQHSLSYLNLFNEDETRTITEYDEHMHPLRIAHWPKYMVANGSTVVAYYPGSFKLRMESKSDYYFDVADYYREDGTLWYQVKLSTSMTEVIYFDASGTKTLLDQTFWRRVKTEDGAQKISYELYTVTIFDDQGNQARQINFGQGGPPNVREDERMDVTIGGVTYKEIDYNYDTDGTLSAVTYWLHKVEYPPQRREEHKPSEQIRSDAVPPSATTIGVQLEEDLPIPPPQRNEGY